MADRKEFEIGGKPLSTLRVVDLKQELEKRGLSKSGSKKELADRLKVQLRLEKLQEDASTDEGHVPNLRLQDEEIADNDLIKDYLSKQQQTYEMQKEARRRVELEEQRVRDSSEASAGDTSQGEEEVEPQNLNVNQSEQTAIVPENQNDDVTEVSTGVLRDVNRTNLSSENSSDNQTSSDALDLSTTGEKHFQVKLDVAESKNTSVEETTKAEQKEPEIVKEKEKPIKITIKKEKPVKVDKTATISEITEEKKELVPEIKKHKESREKPKEESKEQTSNLESGHGSSPLRDRDAEANNPEALVKEATTGGSRRERETSSSPSRESVASESRKKTRRSRRRSSASSRSSSSSRSRSSDSQSSDSRSRSRKRKETKRNEKFRSAVTVEDSTSQSSPRQEIEMKVSADDGDKMMDVEESSNTVDEVSTNENKASRKSDEPPSTTTGSSVKISSRSISLSSIKENQTSEEGKENLDTNEVQVPRKRKWGNSGAATAVIGRKPSLSISTDSLKGLIPEIKPLASANSSPFETAVASAEIVDPRPAPPVKTVTTPTIKREMIVFNATPQVEKENAEVVEPPPKISRILSRRISASGLEAATTKGTPAPARHPPSRIVHIRNLVRPFTLNQLKEHLSKTGTLVEGGFWIDKIKSKCYVTYENDEQAVNTRQNLHGTQWPSSNPKFLAVDFATQDEVEFHRNLSEAPEMKPIPMMIGDNKLINERPVRPNALSPRRGAKVSVDEEKMAEKVRHDSHRISDRDNKDAVGMGGDKEKRGSGGGDRGRNQLNELNNNERDRTFAGNRRDREMDQRARMKEKNKQPPIREWDREKIGEHSPGERDRARVARNRNRSRSTSRMRAGVKSPVGRRDRNRDLENRERNDRRREEEAPAKLLDDLFRKTKTTPCIYWLPLTADQINMKEEQRKLRQVEREKRRQQNDHPAENVKSMSVRSRSKEKEENRSWRKSRSPIKAVRNRRR